MNIFEQLDERDTRRALLFVEAHLKAARGDNAGMTRVLDQMRNGQLNAVSTLVGLSELLIGTIASIEGPETVEERISASVARLTAVCDQLDAGDRDE